VIVEIISSAVCGEEWLPLGLERTEDLWLGSLSGDEGAWSVAGEGDRSANEEN
jgi:hypothetical protein